MKQQKEAKIKSAILGALKLLGIFYFPIKGENEAENI